MKGYYEKLDLPMDEIVGRYRRGESAGSLARAFDTSTGTITARLQKHGVRLRRRHGTGVYRVCSCCRQIKRVDEFYQRDGWCKPCFLEKQKAWYRNKRRRRNMERHAQLEAEGRHRSRLKREAIRLRKAGLNSYEIVDRVGISDTTIRAWTNPYRETREQKLIRAYVEEDVTQKWLAQEFHMSAGDVWRLLREAGVGRGRGESNVGRSDRHAARPTLGKVARATKRRPRPQRHLPRSGWMKDGRLTRKQYDILEILRASPEPLTTARIRQIAELIEASWSTRTSSVNGTVQSLRARGFVSFLPTSHMNAGEPLRAYFAVSEDEAPALSMDEAKRQIEIRALIEDQEADDRDRVKWSGAISLDAARFDDGDKTLHDMLEAVA